jgi:hypothetical protein
MIVGGDGSSASLFVSDDPERTWSVLAPYLLHEVNSYGRWAQDNGANEHLYRPTGDLKVVREMGMYVVMRPEHAQRFVAAAGTAGPMLQPLVGGLPPEIGWEMLERFVKEVLPKTQSSTAGATAK